VNPNGLILLVEECADEALQIQEALRSRGIKNPVYTLHSPAHAIEFLDSLNSPLRDDGSIEAPELVLLSLRADAAQGFPLLRWMREAERSTEREPAAIVLADANEERQLQEALDLGANGFYIRNGVLSELAETIYSLEPQRSNPLRERFERPRSQRLSEQDSSVV
jgi:CheY-like chemotaxis protein